MLQSSSVHYGFVRLPHIKSLRKVQHDAQLVPEGSQPLPDITNEARRETYRLASFKMRKIALPPFQLAMCGFFYIGPGDRVRCFSCGNVVESWKPADDPSSMKWHKSNCKHTTGGDSNNISIGDVVSMPTVTTNPKTPPPSPMSPELTVRFSAAGPRLHSSGDIRKPVPLVIPPEEMLQLPLLSVVHSAAHKQFLDTLLLYKEEDRWKTFTSETAEWPHLLNGLITSLARTGFFFLGNLDRTQCFSCGAVQKNWQPNDDVYRIHAEMFPMCRMIRSIDNRNVPLLDAAAISSPASADFQPKFPEHLEMSRYLQYPPETFNSTAEQPAVLQSSLRPGLQYSKSAEVQPSSKSSEGAESFNNIHYRDQRPSSSSLLSLFPVSGPVGPLPQIHSPSGIFSEVFSRDARATPSSPFSNQMIMQPTETNRTVQPQQPGSIEAVEQTSAPPLLPALDQGNTTETSSEDLLRELDPFAPVTRQREIPKLPLSELDVGEYVSEEEKFSLRDLYPCNNAKVPKMVYLSQRLSSYRVPWPENSSVSTITEAAMAGFYYFGYADHVQCWYCGMEAENWATEKDAWEKHAELFPTCHFLLRNRGPAFVETVLSQLLPENNSPVTREREYTPASEFSSLGETYGGYVQSGPERLVTPPIVHPRDEAEENRLELQRSMSSEVVKAAQTMGFTRNHIKKVVKQQIGRYSCNFQSSEALIDALLATDEDLIDLDQSDEELEQSHNNHGSRLSLEDVDDNLELYEAEEHNPATSTQATEPPGEENEPTRLPDPTETVASIEVSEQQVPTSSRFGGSKELINDLQKMRDERRCKVCLDEEARMVFLPCRHICACMKCTRKLLQCPVCRRTIEKAYLTYSS